jgi:hypothetical protein
MASTEAFRPIRPARTLIEVFFHLESEQAVIYEERDQAGRAMPSRVTIDYTAKIRPVPTCSAGTIYSGDEQSRSHLLKMA